MATSLDVPVTNLLANAELINSLDLQQFADDQVGLLTLEDIREELLRPGRDPRDQFVAPQFREDVTTLAQLEVGMVLEGVVSNVTNFGAFVDIGVHQDGLVHISELSQRFVRDPREVVQVGQVVQVRVLSVDQPLQRISLSMKLQQRVNAPASPARKRGASAPRRRRNRPGPDRAVVPARKTVSAPPRETAPEREMSMEDKLRALQVRFRQVDKS
jgi:uncharacterized protein